MSFLIYTQEIRLLHWLEKIRLSYTHGKYVFSNCSLTKEGGEDNALGMYLLVRRALQDVGA